MMVIMGRAAVQEVATFMVRTMEVAPLVPAFRATRTTKAVSIKVVKAATINNLTKEISSSSNLDIRVTQSN